MANYHVPDYLILPFGRAVKSDLQKIGLSAVSADGLYFTTDVPVIFINKSKKQPLSLGEFDTHIGPLPSGSYNWDERRLLDHMCRTLKSHNPNMTQSEELFLDLYFGALTARAITSAPASIELLRSAGLWRHESGAFVKFTDKGAVLFA